MSSNELKLFEDKRIRTAWDGEQEEWYFSVVDVVSVLTDQATSKSASTYWAVLKKRLNTEGSELLTNCKQLKLTATDGKQRLTDVADTQQLLRIIQSILSPKAEPFKLWLAQVGKESVESRAGVPVITEKTAVDFTKVMELVAGLSDDAEGGDAK